MHTFKQCKPDLIHSYGMVNLFKMFDTARVVVALWPLFRIFSSESWKHTCLFFGFKKRFSSSTNKEARLLLDHAMSTLNLTMFVFVNDFLVWCIYHLFGFETKNQKKISPCSNITASYTHMPWCLGENSGGLIRALSNKTECLNPEYGSQHCYHPGPFSIPPFHPLWWCYPDTLTKQHNQGFADSVNVSYSSKSLTIPKIRELFINPIRTVWTWCASLHRRDSAKNTEKFKRRNKCRSIWIECATLQLWWSTGIPLRDWLRPSWIVDNKQSQFLFHK